VPTALEAGHLNRAEAARQLRFAGPVWTRRCGRSPMGVSPSPARARLAEAAELAVPKEIHQDGPDATRRS